MFQNSELQLEYVYVKLLLNNLKIVKTEYFMYLTESRLKEAATSLLCREAGVNPEQSRCRKKGVLQKCH